MHLTTFSRTWGYYASSACIVRFIDRVEADMVDEADVLIGGEAASFVGADQDPSKLGIESLYKSV